MYIRIYVYIVLRLIYAGACYVSYMGKVFGFIKEYNQQAASARIVGGFGTRRRRCSQLRRRIGRASPTPPAATACGRGRVAAAAAAQ